MSLAAEMLFSPPPASPPPQVMEAHQAKLRFFKASTCQELLERLVGHFMVLSEEVGITCGEDWWGVW